MFWENVAEIFLALLCKKISNKSKADRLDLWDLETMMARMMMMMMMIVMQVRMLLDEGADKGLVDLQGMTAKDHAKEKECVTIIGKPHIMSIVMMMVMLWYV